MGPPTGLINKGNPKWGCLWGKVHTPGQEERRRYFLKIFFQKKIKYEWCDGRGSRRELVEVFGDLIVNLSVPMIVFRSCRKVCCPDHVDSTSICFSVFFSDFMPEATTRTLFLRQPQTVQIPH
jgi:hypothetical protein